MPDGRERIPTFPGSGKTVVLPRLGAPTADTHAHLDMMADPAGALARAARAGIALVCTVVDLTEEPDITFEGIAGWLEEASGSALDTRGASAQCFALRRRDARSVARRRPRLACGARGRAG